MSKFEDLEKNVGERLNEKNFEAAFKGYVELVNLCEGAVKRCLKKLSAYEDGSNVKKLTLAKDDVEDDNSRLGQFSDSERLDYQMRDDPLDDLGVKTATFSLESNANSTLSSNGDLQDDVIIDRVIWKPIAGAKRSCPPSDNAESIPNFKRSHLSPSESARTMSTNSADSEKADDSSTVREGDGETSSVNFLEVTKVSDHVISSTVTFSDQNGESDIEPAAAFWLNNALNATNVFIAKTCSITNSLLQKLTSTTRDNLRELQFSSCKFSLDTLNRFLSKSMNLEVLVLQNIVPVDGVTAVDDVVDTICHMSELRQLNLTGWTCIRNSHVARILESCEKLSHLNISETGVKVLRTYLCDDLQYLNIAGTGVDMNAPLCDALSNLENLSYLNVSNTNFSLVNLETLIGNKIEFEVTAFEVSFGFPDSSSFEFAFRRMKRNCSLKVNSIYT